MNDGGDYGDDLGEAFRKRPSAIETVGAEWRGHFKDGGVSARRYHDATLSDVMRSVGVLSDHQHQAAERLYEMWVLGGFFRPVTSGYGTRGGVGSTSDEPTAADEYRALLRKMPRHLAIYADTLMLGQYHPANLPGIRETLDWCVKEWRL